MYQENQPNKITGISSNFFFFCSDAEIKSHHLCFRMTVSLTSR